MYVIRQTRIIGQLQGTRGFIVPANGGGSFPVNGILDNFNRANEGPPPSANWTTAWRPSSTGHIVSSNQCVRSVAGDSTSYWNTSFGPNVEAYVTAVAGGAADYVGVAARLISVGTASASGYEVVMTGNQVFITRWDNNAQTTLGAAISQTYTAWDALGISCVGTTIKAYYKIGAGAWTEIGSRTDSTYSGSGKIGIRSDTATMDDFGGGTI